MPGQSIDDGERRRPQTATVVVAWDERISLDSKRSGLAVGTVEKEVKERTVRIAPEILNTLDSLSDFAQCGWTFHLLVWSEVSHSAPKRF